MSEWRLPETKKGTPDLDDILEAIYSRAYQLHMDGGHLINAYQNTELIGLQDSLTSAYYIAGRSQVGASGNSGISFWLHEYEPQKTIKQYGVAENSLTIRRHDPAHFYIYSEGEFILFDDEKTDYMTKVLLRTTPTSIS